MLPAKPTTDAAGVECDRATSETGGRMLMGDYRRAH